MSQFFYVSPVADIKVKQVLDLLSIEYLNFATDFAQPSAGLWPSEPAYVYIEGRSGRTIETSIENGMMQISIFAGSAPFDYHLALKLIKCVATLTGGKITTQRDTELSLDQFRQHFDKQWLYSHCKQQLKAIISHAQANPSDCAEVGGVHRSLSVGHELLRTLKDDPDGVFKSFFKRQRQLNYLDSKQVYTAPIVAVPIDDDGHYIKTATLAQGVTTLLTDNDALIGFHSGFDKHRFHANMSFHITVSALKSILKDQYTLLGEQELLVPAISGPMWGTLLVQAQRFAVSDFNHYIMHPQQQQRQRQEFLTAADTALLASAPLVAFRLMIGDKACQNPTQIAAFKSFLIANCQQDNSFTQRMVLQTLSQFDELVLHVLDTAQDPYQMIADIVSALSQYVSYQDATDYRNFIMSLSTAHATRHPGYFWRIFYQANATEPRQALKGFEQSINMALETVI